MYKIYNYFLSFSFVFLRHSFNVILTGVLCVLWLIIPVFNRPLFNSELIWWFVNKFSDFHNKYFRINLYKHTLTFSKSNLITYILEADAIIKEKDVCACLSQINLTKMVHTQTHTRSHTHAHHQTRTHPLITVHTRPHSHLYEEKNDEIGEDKLAWFSRCTGIHGCLEFHGRGGILCTNSASPLARYVARNRGTYVTWRGKILIDSITRHKGKLN